MRIPRRTPEHNVEQAQLAWGEALSAMAQPHVMRFGVDVLPYDPKLYPAQDPKVTSEKGENLPVSHTDRIANSIRPDYIAERERLMEDPFTRTKIETMRRVLDRGDVLFVAVQHADLLDIVYATLIVRDLTSHAAHRQNEPYPADLIVSKMVAIMPGAMETLKPLTSGVHLTLPLTDNAAKALHHIPSEEVDAYNFRAMRQLLKELRQGGMIVGIAPTGTTKQSASIGLSAATETLLTNRRRSVGLRRTRGKYIAKVDVNLHETFSVRIGSPARYADAESIMDMLQRPADYVPHPTYAATGIGNTALQHAKDDSVH